MYVLQIFTTSKDEPMLQTLNKKMQAQIAQGYEASDKQMVRFEVAFKRINKDNQTVTGQVYAPNILDSHSEMMEDEDVLHMGHYWMQHNMHAFDVMHDNRLIKATTLESWIARGHPDYDEGAWVLTIKIDDPTVWKEVKAGRLGGFSVEAWAVKAEAVVEYEVEPMVFGYTEEAEDHDHAYYLMINEKGVVVGGFTSFDKGHRHIVKFGTRTEEATYKKRKHFHRFFLP